MTRFSKGDLYGSLLRQAKEGLDVISYLLTLASNNQWNARRNDISAMFTYARDKMQIITHNPCGVVDKMPHEKAKKKIASKKEIGQLIFAADPKTDERDLITTTLHLLGRIDEVLRLEWEHVDFKHKIVTLRTRKIKDG
ncbi:MAG: hypothetical protein KQH63_03635 [Desulfobulbaceae bacterium]|nr:hypothetical protein [Desulfobulbaceae bacterium]